MYLSIGRSQYLLPPHTKAKTHYCPSLINERVLHCKLKGEKLIQALTRTVLAYNCRTTTTLGAVCNIPQRQYMELGDVWNSTFNPELLKAERDHLWDLDTNYMERSLSSKANGSSASQEIPRILCKPKVHYRIHNSPPTVPVLSQNSPCPPLQFLKIHFSITLPSTPKPSKWSFSPLKPCMHLSCLPYVPHDLPISFFLTWWPEYYFVRSTDHKAPRYVVLSIPLLTRPLQFYYFFLSTLLSDTLCLCSPLSLRDQVSHPYKTTEAGIH